MLIITGFIVIGICIAGFLFVRKLRLKRTLDTDEQIRQWIDIGADPAVSRSYVHAQSQTPPPGAIMVPAPKNISCITGKTSLTESLQALAEKYSFDEFTLVTADGLLLGSSRDQIAAADAAKYSELFSRNIPDEMPGVVLFGLVHKDSTLIGVIRSQNSMTRETEQKVTNDTKDILNWWI